MKKLLSASVITLMITGCAAIPADPQSERVIASPNPAPKGCKYVGQVVGNQGNFFTGGFTSNRNLEEGAMNDLKNKASKKGANYIQLVTNRAGVTGSMSGSFDRHGGFMSGGSEQTNVTNLGNAYICPPKAIGLE
ncbi:TPA: DUF4156 domain-containing protein [Legionella pneumophila]|uniref:DUF4156 domain-containing protein n=1 Tax=Legionella pneumophila TaxID=446 RepID=A0AAN5PIL3_LEGPN|nr:DUF4156 domain-containing protein [Legionella pneumophila]AEW51157.1 cytochrome c type biogenesis protein CycH [Legionella pneumophila subsp. pneumophila ATCC 43290]AGN13771.1 hypothetical protein LP6_0855 [Legionella pneumophila subsp. pneumophila str. Thunder Bay]MCK1860984.1 DUF4156 domain-containing protein [Legionella pneumophila]MCK1870456.1 DUF4156 domain-containing protein [Legionella pneumophila]MCW8437184.1 DUF4156 domain-containing protein [Legionella pneumophila]